MWTILFCCIPYVTDRFTPEKEEICCRMLHGVLPRLELYEVKVSRTVLRGERSSNAPDLPGVRHEAADLIVNFVPHYEERKFNLSSCRQFLTPACVAGG